MIQGVMKRNAKRKIETTDGGLAHHHLTGGLFVSLKAAEQKNTLSTRCWSEIRFTSFLAFYTSEVKTRRTVY